MSSTCTTVSKYTETAAQRPSIGEYLARRGYYVYPQAPGSKSPVANCADRCGGRRTERTCPGPPDCPCTAAVDPCHAQWAASADVALTRARAEQAPRANWAVHLGWSGLVCLDADDHGGQPPSDLSTGSDGADSLPNPGIANGIGTICLLFDHLGLGDPAEHTLTVETPGGGMHVLYRAPSVPLTSTTIAWQVEVKAGPVGQIWAGSQRKDSAGHLGTYRRISDTTEPAPFPAELGRWMTEQGHVPALNRPQRRTVDTSQGGGAHTPAWWSRTRTALLSELEAAPEGQRYHALGRIGLRYLEITTEEGCPWGWADAQEDLVAAQVRRGIHVSEAEYRSQVTALASRVQ